MRFLDRAHKLNPPITYMHVLSACRSLLLLMRDIATSVLLDEHNIVVISHLTIYSGNDMTPFLLMLSTPLC
jgi:hypothetical protein